MARAHRSGRPNDYDWELSRGTSLALAATVIVQFEAFASDTAETLMRLRGEVLVFLDGASSPAVGDLMVFAWGVIRSASGSTDVGVSPLTEGGANFLAYGTGHLGTEATAQLGNEGLSMVRFDVDSKAMRKLRENESLYVVFESVDIAGAPVWNAGFSLRGLTAR